MSKLQLGPMTIEVDGIKYPEWIEGVEGFWDFNRVADSKKPENYAENFIAINETRYKEGVYRLRQLH